MPVDPYAPTASALAESAPALATLSLPYAGPWKRLAAKIVDILLYVVCFIPAAIGGLIGGNEKMSSVLGKLAGGSTMLSIILCLGLLLYTLNLWDEEGQSPGKRILGLRIVRQDGGMAGARALIFNRWLLFHAIGVTLAVAGATPLFLLLDACLVFTARGRTLHDRIAGTVVVSACYRPLGMADDESIGAAAR